MAVAAAAASSLAPCAPASQHRRVTTRTRGASGRRARLVSITLALTPAPAPSNSPCCFVQEGQPTAPRNLRKRGQGQTAGFARGGLARDVRPRPDEYCSPSAPTTRFPAQTLEQEATAPLRRASQAQQSDGARDRNGPPQPPAAGAHHATTTKNGPRTRRSCRENGHHSPARRILATHPRFRDRDR